MDLKAVPLELKDANALWSAHGRERVMKLTEEQETVCRIFASRDRNGNVHCNEFPMRLKVGYAICLKTVTENEAKECWDWDGNPYPALERREK